MAARREVVERQLEERTVGAQDGDGGAVDARHLDLARLRQDEASVAHGARGSDIVLDEKEPIAALQRKDDESGAGAQPLERDAGGRCRVRPARPEAAGIAAGVDGEGAARVGAKPGAEALGVGHARGLLRSMLPARVKDLVDWSTLSVESAELVDDELRGLHADIVYRVRLGARDAFIYVLLEHQSTVDRFMLVRLLEYEVGIWRRHRHEVGAGAPLPVIIPVVLHHSDTGWRTPTDFSELFDADQAELDVVGPFLPLFHFALEDLTDKTDDALRSAQELTDLTRIFLVFLRDTRWYDELIRTVGRWADVIRGSFEGAGGRDALRAVLSYVGVVAKRNHS